MIGGLIVGGMAGATLGLLLAGALRAAKEADAYFEGLRAGLEMDGPDDLASLR